MAIRIPKVGELSRKERDDIKPLFGQRPDAKLFEDFKRLEKSWPEAMEKVRHIAEAAADDLIVLVAGPERPAEHKSEGGVKPEVKQHDRPVYTAAGALRLALGQKYADRHKAFAGARSDPASYHFLWVTDFPMFEWDEDGPALGGGASSLHLAARAGHGQAGERSGVGARAGLRRGAERHRAGLAARSVFIARTSSRKFSRRWA